MANGYLELAEEVLKDHPNGLHINELASSILNLHPNASNNLEEFSRKLSGSLASAIKAKTPRFAKPKQKGKPRKGWYRLKVQKQPTLAVPTAEKDLSSQNIGCGGEHAVISELLFNGFNAANMVVDDGIDVAAFKRSNFFHIQVKTSSPRADGTIHFSVKRKAFQKKTEANTFYVFVMRRVLKNRKVNDFLILPQKLLKYFDTSGLLKGKDTISLNISFIGTDRFFLNKIEEVAAQTTKVGNGRKLP